MCIGPISCSCTCDVHLNSRTFCAEFWRSRMWLLVAFSSDIWTDRNSNPFLPTSSFSVVLGVVAVEADWFARLAPQHCTLSDPLDIPAPSWDDSEGLVKCHQTVAFGMRKKNLTTCDFMNPFAYPRASSHTIICWKLLYLPFFLIDFSDLFSVNLQAAGLGLSLLSHWSTPRIWRNTSCLLTSSCRER